MPYALLNAFRVIVSYAVMLAFAAWAYPRFFTFASATSVSLLYVFAFVPLSTVRLWKRLLYITLTALPLMIIPIGYSVLFGRVHSLNVFWETVEVTLLVGLLGPQYFVFLLIYIVLDFPLRRFVMAQIEALSRQGTI